MIGSEYIREMARYNAWQNRQLFELLQAMDEDDLYRDRGAFFGSIMGTLGHLLWGDHIWMSRFDGGSAPEGGIAHSAGQHTRLDSWRAARETMDGRIVDWARTVDEAGLQGDLDWYSGAVGAQVTRPVALCVVHMFNHQTHHRGQVHAMLTAAGSGAPVSDLVFMPPAG